jgi:hypothetical protein
MNDDLQIIGRTGWHNKNWSIFQKIYDDFKLQVYQEVVLKVLTIDFCKRSLSSTNQFQIY